MMREKKKTPESGPQCNAIKYKINQIKELDHSDNLLLGENWHSVLGSSVHSGSSRSSAGSPDGGGCLITDSFNKVSAQETCHNIYRRDH